ncbi:MAG TPA: hypothetical protein VKT32_14090 [Chthonomonadaceae bacterium]|nr:hypothetical protein [Chthonomonadaceae bacterium]
MKVRILLFFLAYSGFASLAAQSVSAQATPGNRAFNPFAIKFRRLWDFALPDPVKLMEIGPVTGDGKEQLLLLVGGKDDNDYKRKLLVTHWDGFQFATDSTTEFLGTSVDVLLAGRFRPAAPAPALKPARGAKRAPARPSEQVVTTEGVYDWNGKNLNRLFAAPTDLRLELVLDSGQDQLVGGNGDNAVSYALGQDDIHPSEVSLAPEEDGYVHFGIGTQEIPGGSSLELLPDVRYAQSYWSKRDRWLIGIRKDPRAGAQNPAEQIVVYTPTFASRDRTFWAMNRDHLSEFVEEAWRSDLLPGHILDVRVGDPKNEGKEGILVLTSENGGKQRHLYFYGLAQGLGN